MKRLLLAAAIMAVFPAVAQAKAPTLQHARTYERVYHEVAHKFGRRAPGRNIMRDGFNDRRGATDADVVGSIAVLERMLEPAPAPVSDRVSSSRPYHTAYRAAVAPSYSSSSGGAGGVPACASESGSNYSTGAANTNGSSGATGRYQITPSTAANYGCNLSTPGGQDACAATIYAHQGASAWVGCGG